MRRSLLVCSVPAALALLLQVSSAKADGLVDVSAGVKGFVGGNLFTNPGSVPPILGDGLGFVGNAGGMGWGAGGYVEGRFIKFIGLEVGLTYDKSALYRNVTYNGVTKVREKVDTTSLRLPILAKGILPVPFGRLSVFLGPEMVFANDASASNEITSGEQYVANKSQVESFIRASKKNSTMLTMGMGLTIELPAKLELPIELRASKNMSQDADYAGRVNMVLEPVPGQANAYQIGSYTVAGQNSWDFRLGVGLGYRF